MPTHQPIDLTPLDRVINRFPLTVAADTLVVDAITVLNQAQTNCVLVIEDSQLVGIFTERDVVRLVASRRDFASLKLFEVMTKQVITLIPSNSQIDASAVFSLMRQHRLRHLPIVDTGDRLLGLVSQDSAIFQESGQYVDALAMAAEITNQQAALLECQRTEAALTESEHQFHMMADTAPFLIWIAGTDKFCNYFNQPWLEFTGRTLEQEVGNGWAEGVHRDDFQRCQDTYFTAFEARQPFTLEYRLRRFDGEYRWLLDTGNPRFNSDGSFAGCYIGSCIDISERKRVEEALRQYERIVSATPDGVALVDRNYTYRLINQTYLLLHEKCYDEIIGHTLGELLGEDVFTRTIKPLLDRSLAVAYLLPLRMHLTLRRMALFQES